MSAQSTTTFIRRGQTENSFFDLLPEEKAELLLVEDEEEKK
jgi:hypothetical protein